MRIEPPICPYCKATAVLRRRRVMRIPDLTGKVWVCPHYPACDSYVAAHHATGAPLGRLADPELRAAKIDAHAAFNPLKDFLIRHGRESRENARDAVYLWLSDRMGIPLVECRIALFDLAACRRVVELCGPYRDAPWRAGL